MASQGLIEPNYSSPFSKLLEKVGGHLIDKLLVLDMRSPATHCSESAKHRISGLPNKLVSM